MKTSKVRQLEPIDRMLYWIQERHAIALRRKAGEPKPWTDDEILQSYFFTHPYREWDKVTVWFRENLRDPLRDDPRVVLATVIFRWFNYIPTGEVLIRNRLVYEWDRERCLKVLGRMRDNGKKLFTGAFLINSPPGEGKLEAISRMINNVWKDRKNLIAKIEKATTLEDAHKALTVYERLGGFMAYEIVCDLRYTYLLENATDIMTWCNPGPGAIRGLYRLLGRDFPKGKNNVAPPIPKDWTEQTQRLLALVNRRLPKDMPRFEMRELEHSLCEWDKMERLLWKDGRSKRRFSGASD